MEIVMEFVFNSNTGGMLVALGGFLYLTIDRRRLKRDRMVESSVEMEALKLRSTRELIENLRREAHEAGERANKAEAIAEELQNRLTAAEARLSASQIETSLWKQRALRLGWKPKDE